MESVVSPNVSATSPSVLSSFDNVQSDIANKPSFCSPPLPARSPLRPKTFITKTPLITPPQEMMSSRTYIVSPESLQIIQTRSLSSLSGNEILQKKQSIPLLPDSPSPLSPVDIDDEGSSTSSIPTSPPVPMSKRTHALLELLSSERAYASDLALIRDIHIPLALGQASPFNTATASSRSSASSSRTLSTESDASSSSTPSPAMSREDVKLIFNNISELAVLADSFTGRLEDALGSVLEGGQGPDRVGELFLEMIPALEPPYTYYITRHPAALEHLNNLPQSSSLSAYLQHTRTLASSLTHAWDLPSLLIKPVQRLLKYSLLLTAIIDGTSDDHVDKENLKFAKAKMDEVARGVNEGRRRREVVKELLAGGKREDSSNAGSTSSTPKAKRKGLNVGVAASVRLGKMKNLRHAARASEGADENQEREQIDKMEAELKQCDIFIRKFAKEVVNWGGEVKDMMCCLSNWTQSFGRVIGISEDQVSESFDAFRMVIDRQILGLCNDLEQVIKERLLTQLARLVDTTLPPSRLLEALHTLEPMHYGLLNLNVSKSRPPPALLEASQSYVALRGQLFDELPQYLELLHKGIVAATMQLAVWQSQFWGDVRERWMELWEALRVDGEMNIAGAPETVSIWWERFSIIDDGLSELDILKKLDKLQPVRSRTRDGLPYQVSSQTEPRERLPASPSKSSASQILSILAALEPAVPGAPYAGMAVPTPKSPVSGSDSLQRQGTRRSSDASRKGSTRSQPKTTRDIYGTVDGFDIIGTSPTSPGSYMYVKSMEDQLRAPPMRRQFSDVRQMPVGIELPRSPLDYGYAEASRETSRKPSTRRLTDSLRVSLPSGPGLPSARRSPSLPSLTKSRSLGLRSSSPIPHIPRGETYPKTQPTTPKRSSFVYTTPVMYECEAITKFNAGRDIRYKGIPFHKVEIGHRLGIIQEAGHPCTHPNLPIHVDDGEDCLLMARDVEGNVGWAFASFLIPVD